MIKNINGCPILLLMFKRPITKADKDLRNKAKIDQFPNPDNLHVIYGNSDEMKSILSFVKTRYGTNFTEVLYDK